MNISPMNTSFYQVLQTYMKESEISIHRKGTILQTEDSYMYILLGGMLQYYRTLDKFKLNSLTLNLIFDNSLFGNFEHSVSNCVCFSYYKCITNIKIMKLKNSQFVTILKQEPEYVHMFFKMFYQRLIDTEKFLAILSHKEIGNRLAHFLLLIANYYGISTSRGIFININLSHETIANILNTTRVTITRLMGEFRRIKMIQIQGRKIILLRPIALSDYLNLVQ
uniref:Global nitrogen regulator n=1 Tax=Sciadococcus taiwanensis TaxID=3028030 RepID=A0A9Y1I210_9RHOD|nr:global nitrogen regulator [Sciadococcus taiwanensis]